MIEIAPVSGRRVAKPWGHEVIWALTDRYAAKLLVIEADAQLSLQLHARKDEWVLVLDGELGLALEDADGEMRSHVLRSGESAHVPPTRRHRFSGRTRVALIEVSSPELDDVVRLADDYGRQGTTAP